jgi:hypothetical protein
MYWKWHPVFLQCCGGVSCGVEVQLLSVITYTMPFVFQLYWYTPDNTGPRLIDAGHNTDLQLVDTGHNTGLRLIDAGHNTDLRLIDT